MNVKPNNIFFFALAIYFLNNLEWQVWNKSLSPVIMYKVKYPLSLVYLFSTSNAFSRTWINVLVHDMIAIASHEFSQPRGSTLVEWSHLRMTGYEVPMQSLGDRDCCMSSRWAQLLRFLSHLPHMSVCQSGSDSSIL